MSEPKTCGNCAAWAGVPGMKHALCLRYPPTVVVLPNGQFISENPVTNRMQRCLDFIPKDSGQQ